MIDGQFPGSTDAIMQAQQEMLIPANQFFF